MRHALLLGSAVAVAIVGCGSGSPGGGEASRAASRTGQPTTSSPVATSSTVSPTSQPATSSPVATSSTVAPTSQPTTSASASQAIPRGVPRGAQQAKIERVVDGDTVALRALRSGSALMSTEQVTVRLLEVDTPETVNPNTGVECYGPEAAAFTKRVARPGSRVWVERDQEARDRYGRHLLYVWTADGTFLNKELVRTGHATAVLYEPNDRYIQQMRRAEREAKAENRGLWGKCAKYAEPKPRNTGRSEQPEQGPSSSRLYDNCAEAGAAGDLPILRGQRGYGRHLDRDGDGVACEPLGQSNDGSLGKPKPKATRTSDGGSSTYYRNCTAARAAGAAPIRRGESGYGRHLDRDNDGIACDS